MGKTTSEFPSQRTNNAERVYMLRCPMVCAFLPVTVIINLLPAHISKFDCGRVCFQFKHTYVICIEYFKQLWWLRQVYRNLRRRCLLAPYLNTRGIYDFSIFFHKMNVTWHRHTFCTNVSAGHTEPLLLAGIADYRFITQSSNKIRPLNEMRPLNAHVTSQLGSK